MRALKLGDSVFDDTARSSDRHASEPGSLATEPVAGAEREASGRGEPTRDGGDIESEPAKVKPSQVGALGGDQLDLVGESLLK